MLDHIGYHIVVNELNPFFRHVTRMLFYHFDKPEYENYRFVVGSYVQWPMYNFNEQHKGKKVIAYQLEALREGCEGWQPTDILCDNLSSAHHIWDQDSTSAAFLEKKGLHVERILPMLYTPTLREVPAVEKDIDVLFFGYLNERRFSIIRVLEPLFYNKHSLVWLYGMDYDKLIGYMARAKIILNLHQSDKLIQQEQVRMFYALINSKCVVSEPSETNHFGSAIIECPVSNLGTTVSGLLTTGQWEHVGKTGHDIFEAQSKALL